MTEHLASSPRVGASIRPCEPVVRKFRHGQVVAPNDDGDLGERSVRLHERKVIGPNSCPGRERKNLPALLVQTQKLRSTVVAERVEVLKERVNTRRPITGRTANGVSDPYDVCVRVSYRRRAVSHPLGEPSRRVLPPSVAEARLASVRECPLSTKAEGPSLFEPEASLTDL